MFKLVHIKGTLYSGTPEKEFVHSGKFQENYVHIGTLQKEYVHIGSKEYVIFITEYISVNREIHTVNDLKFFLLNANFLVP